MANPLISEDGTVSVTRQTREKQRTLSPEISESAEAAITGRRMSSVGSSGAARRVPVSLFVQDLCYSVVVRDPAAKSPFAPKKQMQILSEISASIEHSQLVALMGPSGAGKTTLLNVLCGRAGGLIDGDVLLNDRPLHPKTVKLISNFIPQDDILLQSLTVHETLSYAAQLRISPEQGASFREQKIEELLDELSLAVCRDTLVGSIEKRGISGGERKRVSIAVELLTNPSLLFVDEPTSGLDSKCALDVCSILSDLARRGRTIICTIHQPSSAAFDRFDRLLLLNKGHVAYFGLTSGMLPYFESVGHICPRFENPCDFMMEALHEADAGGAEEEEDEQASNNAFAAHWQEYTRAQLGGGRTSEVINSQGNRIVSFHVDSAQHVCDHHFRQTDLAAADSRSQPSFSATQRNMMDDCQAGMRYPTSLARQSVVLFRRTFRTTFKDEAQFRMRFSTTVFVAVMVGLIYLQTGLEQRSAQDRQAALFMVVFFSLMDACLSTIAAFPLERSCLIREYKNGYFKLVAFFLAKIGSMLLFQVLYSLIFGAVVFFMVGLSNFTVFWLTLTMMGFIGCLLGLVVGTMAENVQMAQTAVPPMMLPLIVFSGFLQRPDNIKVYFVWLYHLSFFMYGFSSLCINEFQDGQFEECTEEDQLQHLCPYGAGVIPKRVVLEVLDFDADNLEWNMFVLLGYIGFFILSGYYLMKYQTRKKHA